MYIGCEKIPQLPWNLQNTYYDYRLIITGFTGIYPFTIIFLVQPMIWPIFVHLLDISPFYKFLPIIICISHRTKQPWYLCLLSNQINTALTSYLFSTPSEMGLVRNMLSQSMHIRQFEIPIAKNSDSILSSTPVTILSNIISTSSTVTLKIFGRFVQP